MRIKVIGQVTECPKGETDIALSVGCEGCDLWEIGQCVGIGKYHDLFMGEVSDEQLEEVKSIVQKSVLTVKLDIDPSIIDAIRRIYYKEIKSGMFFEWYSELTGNWEDDKCKFVPMKLKEVTNNKVDIQHKERE